MRIRAFVAAIVSCYGLFAGVVAYGDLAYYSCAEDVDSLGDDFVCVSKIAGNSNVWCNVSACGSSTSYTIVTTTSYNDGSSASSSMCIDKEAVPTGKCTGTSPVSQDGTTIAGGTLSSPYYMQTFSDGACFFHEKGGSWFGSNKFSSVTSITSGCTSS